MTAPVSFRLNGRTVTVEGRDEVPLLFVLRNELGLMATRFGCGQEQCGACMVAVEGQARYACTAPLRSVAEAKVVTAEGLSGDPVGAALLEAFVVEQAGQCGYCLSGILVSAFVLLTSTPNPGRSAILAALDPHLCRCGAHGSIFRAVERAAARLAEEAA